LPLPSAGSIEQALAVIIGRSLNVRQTETLVKRILADVGEQPPAEEDDVGSQVQASLTWMEDRFRSTLGTRVKLKRRADGSGQLIVHFYSDDDLQHIYSTIAGDLEE
jgi:ParB family chromosome partitioning protein